jgi:DNA-binding transcriptional regulator LsrR (DeoR family)
MNGCESVKERDAELVLRVARLYYEGGFSQDEVAVQVGTSRSNVSRMLTVAKAMGFVEIRVIAPLSRQEGISNELQKSLKIREVHVMTSEPNESTLNTVGRAAARILVKALRPNQTIAISWGRGLEATIHEIQSDLISGLKITQLMGSLSSIPTSISAEEVGRVLARNLNAQFIPFLAPIFVSTPEVRQNIYQERAVSETLKLARKADIALVGIGSKGATSSELVITDFNLSASEEKNVRQKYAGDVAARFFDVNGNPVSAELDSRLIGLTLDEIRNIPKVIGVASGADKALGVLGAARTGLIDVLVIDNACATAILKVLAPAAVKSA